MHISALLKRSKFLLSLSPLLLIISIESVRHSSYEDLNGIRFLRNASLDVSPKSYQRVLISDNAASSEHSTDIGSGLSLSNWDQSVDDLLGIWDGQRAIVICSDSLDAHVIFLAKKLRRELSLPAIYISRPDLW
jgi:hypothetical protein